MTVGNERNHLHVWRRGDEPQRRHWLLGDQWHATVTLGGRYLGTIAKGWWILGTGSLNRHLELETAIGGEDNMLQIGVVIPFLARVHAGVRVPRRLVRGWIYHRRELTVRIGYLGRWAELLIARDEDLADMAGYYRRCRERGEALSWNRVQLHPGWHLSLNPRLRDRLLGRPKHTVEEGEPVPVEVPMPEGNYPGTVVRQVRTWQRPRWPFGRKQRVDYSIDMDVPIPVPGKGENSWDCDDDAIHGTGGATLAEAVSNATHAALRRREQYANKDWTPAAGWSEGVAR